MQCGEHSGYSLVQHRQLFVLGPLRYESTLGPENLPKHCLGGYSSRLKASLITYPIDRVVSIRLNKDDIRFRTTWFSAFLARL